MEFIRESEIADIFLKISAAEELTPYQRQLLDDWLAESNANRELYDGVVSGAMFSRRAALYGSFDKAKGLRQTAVRMRRQARRRRIAVAVSLAGAVLIAAMLIFVPFDSYRDAGFRSIAELAATSPGTQQATLFYGDNTVALSRTEQGAEWEKFVDALQGGEQVEPTDEAKTPVKLVKVEVPRGGEYRIDLKDGTTVWLNSESSIVYPFEFAADERTVRITGEVYFDVAHDARRPFAVEFSDACVRVLGTSFNVSAYDSDAAATVTLVSGRVEVGRGDAVVELTPGKQASLERNREQIEVNDVDVSLYTGWTNGVFAFEGMPLGEICRKLSRWYDIEFEFEGDAAEERFTGGTWRYSTLGEFLESIEMVTDIEFDYRDRRVIVSQKR